MSRYPGEDSQQEEECLGLEGDVECVDAPRRMDADCEEGDEGGEGDEVSSQPQITRERVLARLWELAMMDPEETRGTRHGQLQALDLIRRIVG